MSNEKQTYFISSEMVRKPHNYWVHSGDQKSVHTVLNNGVPFRSMKSAMAFIGSQTAALDAIVEVTPKWRTEK